MVKKVLIGLLILVVIMQLLQPTRNISEGISENDITKMYAIPADVQIVFEQKCYDCHSNNTRYPWYIHIQPIGWWMASHIKKAKDDLNFSEFKTYSQKQLTHKLEEVSEVVNEGEMPLRSYIWLHKEAEVTPTEKTAINDWVNSIIGEKEKTSKL